MGILWTPWRSQYIDTFRDEDEKNGEACFLCQAAQSPENDTKLLVAARREHCFAILNKYPYNNGHTLIAPYRHICELSELSDDELINLTFTIREAANALGKIYKPHGFNIGINIGRAAGAGVPGHLHYHIVPRWVGDTSFTSVFADTKVVSESLVHTRKLLSDEMNNS